FRRRHVGGTDQEAEIGRVDRRRLDPHHDLVGPRLRRRHIEQRDFELAALLDQRTQLQPVSSVTHRSLPAPVLAQLQASAFSAARPAYFACLPSCSSMRRSWLYLAVRSERASEPVLICPQLVATARSEIVESSVSPERCDITAV